MTEAETLKTIFDYLEAGIESGEFKKGSGFADHGNPEDCFSAGTANGQYRLAKRILRLKKEISHE